VPGHPTRQPEYALVIGARVTFQRHDVALLTNDAGNRRIGIRANPEYEATPNPSREIGMHHSAFEYRSLDELLLTWVRLEREGVSPAYCLDHGMTTSFYYRGPDGNHVELQADNWGDWSESTVFMREDPRFHEDPIGKPIDPAKLREARRVGLSPWEIHVVAGTDRRVFSAFRNGAERGGGLPSSA
jgi:catechol 2,3-dioxygenase